MRKKLQIYNGIVAYKADKTPIKRAFYGKTKADARQKYATYLEERGQLDKPTITHSLRYIFII